MYLDRLSKKGGLQLKKSQYWFKINFWDFSFRAQFGPPPRAGGAYQDETLVRGEGGADKPLVQGLVFRVKGSGLKVQSWGVRG